MQHSEQELSDREKCSLRLLRVSDVAAMLQVSRSAVYELMTRGELGFIKIGRSRRVEPAEVQRLIARGRIGGLGESAGEDEKIDVESRAP